MTMLPQPKYMRTIIGYIGEKCAVNYLNKLGFKIHIEKGKFEDITNRYS